MAKHDNGTVRKKAEGRAPASPDTPMGDSDRIRLSSLRGSENKPPASGRFDGDLLGGAQANAARQIRDYKSTRGRISSEADIRFQPIVSNDTHQRIREARRRLKHVPFNPVVEIPTAVGVDFTAIHACNCGAYEVIKRKKENGQEERKT